MNAKSLTGRAHAKINLGLEILRKRPDGYHDIRTVFYPIAMEDEITCDLTDAPPSLTVTGADLPADGGNLCLRAATLLRDRSGISEGVHIHLRKRIPIGAGLGGGSSDAACVLTLLNELWELRESKESLASIASELGADVSYFLTGGLTYADGRGDRLERLDLSFPHWVITVVPNDSVSTAWAYGQIVPREDRSTDLKEAFKQSVADIGALDGIVQNDFEAVVLPGHPAIASAMDLLRRGDAQCVRMSGTGSAVFGIASSEQQARRIAASFSQPFITSLTPPYIP